MLDYDDLMNLLDEIQGTHESNLTAAVAMGWTDGANVLHNKLEAVASIRLQIDRMYIASLHDELEVCE